MARSRYNWDYNIRRLKKQPGEWAVVLAEDEEASIKRDAVAAIAYRIKTGNVPGMKKGEYDAAVRGSTVYAKYLGG